jgi:hypothetical protein
MKEISEIDQFREKIEQLRKKEQSLYFTLNALDNVHLHLLDRIKLHGTVDAIDEAVLNTFNSLADKYLKNPEEVTINELQVIHRNLTQDLLKLMETEAQLEISEEEKNKSGIVNCFSSAITQMAIGALFCAGFGTLLMYSGEPRFTWFTPIAGALLGTFIMGVARGMAEIGISPPIEERRDQKYYSFWHCNGRSSIGSAFKGMEKDCNEDNGYGIDLELN